MTEVKEEVLLLEAPKEGIQEIGAESEEAAEVLTDQFKIYLASPFFNEAQLDRVAFVENVLGSRANLDVFSPRQEKYTEEFGSMEWRETVFAANAKAILDGHIMVAVYDEEDSGTMAEIGIAAALNMPIIVFKETDQPMNIMISEVAHAVIESREELEAYDFSTFPSKRYEGKVF
ncbi:nucleoside 2-deoxyribosyltransferase [Bacillus wiedmannii]|uniref:nucleoside 2-deoxyribosyltransferase n=1 Tax=Bacillus wiedmannii TaxID=1890302 RepID=UPI000BF12CA0|nr:nucleoside 2-deoxyribosyltransferase [Bacillus wiedmannii]PEM08538.1 nucleoside 2-deoxyribosyltransferase [Bacillus wiedmannii]